jgi:hypothetical protein
LTLEPALALATGAVETVKVPVANAGRAKMVEIRVASMNAARIRV